MRRDASIPAEPQGWRDRATLNLWPETAAIVKLSKNSIYAAARSGAIPTVKIGGRWLVPVARLRRMLGELPEGAA